NDRNPQRPLPEDRAVRLDRALKDVGFRRHTLAHDQPPADDAEEPARDKHGKQAIDERPADAQLQPDEREGKGCASNEEREDPEDDHGGSLTIRGRVSMDPAGDRIARAMTTAIPIATTMSPGLYASGTRRPIGPGSAIQSASQPRFVCAVITVYWPSCPPWTSAPARSGATGMRAPFEVTTTRL